YGYSRFCDLFREFERRLSPVMRQHHVAGDKVFVDYSGKKIAIVNPATGEVREAEIFVAVLGASNYTDAQATWTQTLPDRVEAHVRMFRFFGGVPIARWYEVIGDPTLADAILDRIVHNAYRIELKGESMRKLKATKTEPDARKPVKEAPQNVTASASAPAKVRRK